MDRLTKERIEDIKAQVEIGCANFNGTEFAALCDLALQSLSQEAVRDEVLEAVCLNIQRAVSDYTRRTPPHLRDCDVLTGHIVRALKREPNAAAESYESAHPKALDEPAPAAPDVADIHKHRRAGDHWEATRAHARLPVPSLSRLCQDWVPVDRTAEYQEHHFKVDDVGVAWNGNRVWVCADSGALLRAKVIGEKLFVEFTPPPPERP